MLDVRPDVVLRPVKNRIEFGDAARFVRLLQGECATGDGLCAPLSGQPGVGIGQGAVERRDFADVAATLTQFHALVKGVQPVRLHIFGDLLRVGMVEAEIERRITRAHHFGIGERFRVQPPGFQHEHFDRGGELRQLVGNHHVLDREAAGEFDPLKLRVNRLQTRTQLRRFLRQAREYCCRWLRNLPQRRTLPGDGGHRRFLMMCIVMLPENRALIVSAAGRARERAKSLLLRRKIYRQPHQVLGKVCR